MCVCVCVRKKERTVSSTRMIESIHGVLKVLNVYVYGIATGLKQTYNVDTQLYNRET